MKIKVVAHTSDEEGLHFPGEILDMREGTAKEWIKKQWAIALPVEKKEEPEPVVEAKAEVMEAPEDHMPKHETASMKRKKK
jgi:hypothetical protein